MTLLKKVLCRVQQENTELKANSAQQRRRIDELTARAAQLALHIADQAGNSVQFQAENLVSGTFSTLIPLYLESPLFPH